MKVLIDTNILISAALSNRGTPYAAYMKAVTYPYHGVICDQNIDELRKVFNRKFSAKIQLLDSFLAIALTALQLIETPVDEFEQEKSIRDVKDRPILRAAINVGVDILLTGDKDFLEADIDKPKTITAADFLKL
ncbi:putative toxin-antitoxin system toxin component, PIN family [Monoglobus pectinilyticus]|uniref:putative toxin-antitoxin system toxin component, PIN family n=1 Tax=Monoglobus pectinilyticus TaxID=1981510 RepID=UPI002A750664|nr:putative toxin-antitoxin system toxin component, PIN family [Monoglobus pectinilyticus]